MLHIRHEPMNADFWKFHLHSEEFPEVTPVQHFHMAHQHGDPHDHPGAFTSFVDFGGYVERVFNPTDGSSELIHRKPYTSFRVEATHIHTIEALPMGRCLTHIVPHREEQPDRVWRYWQFRDDGAWSRAWNETEWIHHA